MLPGQSIKAKNTHPESWLGLNIFHVLPEIFINVFITLKSLTSKSLAEVHQGAEVVVCHWSPLAGQHQLVDAVASFTICWVYADFCVSPRHSIQKVSPAARSRTHRSQPLHMLKCCWTVEISIKFIFRDWIEAWECIWRGSHTHTSWRKLMAGCPAVLLPHIYEYNNKLVDCVNAVTFYCKRTSLHSVFDKMIVSREN